MAVTRVRSLNNAGYYVGTPNISAFPATIPIGDTVVIWLYLASGTGAVTASDNSTQTGTANTWTKVFDSGTASASARLVCLVSTLTRSLLTTDTIAITSPSGTYYYRAVQYTGSPTGFDAASTAKSFASATSVTTNLVTTVAGGGMAIAAMATPATAAIATVGTVGGGTATVGSTSLEGDGASTYGGEIADEDAQFSAGGTIDGSFTFTSQSGVCAIITLASASSPGNATLGVLPLAVSIPNVAAKGAAAVALGVQSLAVALFAAVAKGAGTVTLSATALTIAEPNINASGSPSSVTLGVLPVVVALPAIAPSVAGTNTLSGVALTVAVPAVLNTAPGAVTLGALSLALALPALVTTGAAPRTYTYRFINQH